MSTEIDEEGIRVARRYAQWHLGDPSWANAIIEAYLRPQRASEALAEEMAE